MGTFKIGAVVTCIFTIWALAPWKLNPEVFKCSGDRYERIIYSNDFNCTPGSSFPEWSSRGYSFAGDGLSGAGKQKVTNIRSPNGNQTFLGEFGGPYIVPKGSRAVFRVDEMVRLSLDHLATHDSVSIAFDLYVLKSWDGDSPQYGLDRFRLSVPGGPPLINTTFSNNPKVSTDGSLQEYPSRSCAPQSGAVSIGTLGYNNYFQDSIYHFKFTFAYPGDTLKFDFASSLFEGKGTDDESWGLDNVRVIVINIT